MSADGEPDNTVPANAGNGADLHALAQTLLVEAVDCIRQAGDLIEARELSAAVRRYADEIAQLAEGLWPPATEA